MFQCYSFRLFQGFSELIWIFNVIQRQSFIVREVALFNYTFELKILYVNLEQFREKKEDIYVVNNRTKNPFGRM